MKRQCRIISIGPSRFGWLKVAVFLAGILAPAIDVLAQQGPDDDADVKIGYTNNVFHHSSVDSINLYNGALTIPVPLGPSYPVGPKLRFQAMLTYGSRVWEFGHPTLGDIDSQGNLYMPLVGDPAIGIGWTFTLGAIKKCGENQSYRCFVGPDGAEHQFNGTIPPTSSKPGDASQFYLTGNDTSGYDMWDADGNHYDFTNHVTGYDDPYDHYLNNLGRGRDGWYVTDITDPFGNIIHVDYFTPLGNLPCWDTGSAPPPLYGNMACRTPTSAKSWVPSSIQGYPEGQPASWTVTVNRNGTTGRISSFLFPTVGAASATWSLGYDYFTWSAGPPNAPAVNVYRLTSITLPTTSYSFTYLNGLARTMTLPTGAEIDYLWSTYHFYHARHSSRMNCGAEQPPPGSLVLQSGRPSATNYFQGDPPPSPHLNDCTGDPATDPTEFSDAVQGVGRRTEIFTDNDGAQRKAETDYVQVAFPFGEKLAICATPGNDTCGSQTLTIAIFPRGIEGRAHATATLFWSDSGTFDGSTATGDRIGADIETRTFDFDPWVPAGDPDPTISQPACTVYDQDFCPKHAVRVTQRVFDYDCSGTVDCPGTVKGNRRLLSETTFHQSTGPSGACVGCKFTSTTFSNPSGTWEGRGRHYGREVRSGNLQGPTETKTIDTTWFPVNWTSAPPTGGAALPNLFTEQDTLESGRTIVRLFLFDTTSTTADGFLKGQITWDSTGGRAYVKCRFADSRGNASDNLVESSTGAMPTLSGTCGTYTASTPVGDDSPGFTDLRFGKRYTYQNGEVTSAAWKSGAAPASWYVRNYARDPETGWVTDSYDTAGARTHYDYDTLGRVTKITPNMTTGTPGDADGEIPTTITYNSTTLTTVQRSGGAGLTTWQQYEYDDFGRLIRERRKNPGGSIFKQFTRFDDAGHDYFHSEWVADSAGESISATQSTVCKYTDGNGVESNFTTNRPTGALGTYTTCFDPFGRPQKVVRSKHNSIQTIYRTDGASFHSDSFEQVTNYCLNGSFSGATCNGTAPLNPITTNERDSFGRLISVLEPNLTDLALYAYDPNDKLRCVIQGGSDPHLDVCSATGGQVRKFDYDAGGNLIAELTPERGSTPVTYTYGGLGNLLNETLPGATITRAYDFAGRVSSVKSGTKTFATNYYDGNGFAGGTYKLGKLTRQVGGNYDPLGAATQSITQDFTYSDPSGRLSSRATTVSGGITATDKWAYNVLGLPSDYWHARTSGGTPFLASTAYDYGLPVTVYANGIPMAKSISYSASGAVYEYFTGLGTGHDVKTRIDPDTNGLPRPALIGTTGASSEWSSGSYSYDGAGDVMTMGADSFTYDDRARLLSASYSGVSSQYYCYDRYGNRFNKTTTPPSCGTTTWTNNRVPTGTYDARGNMTNYGGKTYSFDALDRIVRHFDGSQTWNYYFDAAGERVVKVPPPGLGAWNYTFRDEANRLATEYSGSTFSRDDVYLGNLLLASYANTLVGGNSKAWTYYSSDHLGSPRLITDIAGAMLEKPRYWPYGDEVVTVTQPQRLRFAGMERDTESLVYFDHARSEEFTLGRFLSPDQVAGSPRNPQTWNRYSYGRNNPMRFSDPTGLVEVELTYRFFIPSAGVASPLGAFKGDTRGFSLSKDASVRTEIRLTVETDPNKRMNPLVGAPQVRVGETTNLVTGAKGLATGDSIGVKVSRDSNGNVVVRTFQNEGIPKDAAPPAGTSPFGIRASTETTISPSGDSITLEGSRSSFPAMEVNGKVGDQSFSLFRGNAGSSASGLFTTERFTATCTGMPSPSCSQSPGRLPWDTAAD